MPAQAPSSRSRRVVPIVAGLLAMLFVAPGFAGAQSLAELARREEARRKAVRGDTKVFTNRDLAGRAEPAPVSTAGAPPATGQPGAPAPAAAQQPAPAAQAQQPTPDEPKKDEKYWRQRITEAQDKLARNQVLLEALQSRVNALSTDFVNRDDPAQRAVISQDRQKALSEMNRMTKDIEGLKKEIADIQEEARKAGVPPGWIR